MKQQIQVLMNGERIVIVQGERIWIDQHLHSWPSITKSTMLPNVLLAPIEGNSISMVRALKQIRELLEIIDTETFEVQDKIYASIGDIDTMLAAIK